MQVKGQSIAMKQFDLKQCELKLVQQSQPMLTVSGSGTYDLATTNADMQVKVLAMLVPAEV